MDREDLIDLVADLQHDLGKYLRQPLAFLPETAGEDEIRAALDEALHRTRRTPRGVRGAVEIWDEIVDEGGVDLQSLSGFPAVEAAVEKALAWAEALQQPMPIDRAKAQADLSAVAAAVADLRDEVRGL